MSYILKLNEDDIAVSYIHVVGQAQLLASEDRDNPDGSGNKLVVNDISNLTRHYLGDGEWEDSSFTFTTEDAIWGMVRTERDKWLDKYDKAISQLNRDEDQSRVSKWDRDVLNNFADELCDLPENETAANASSYMNKLIMPAYIDNDGEGTVYHHPDCATNSTDDDAVTTVGEAKMLNYDEATCCNTLW